MRGFYLSIDITIAGTLTILVLMALLFVFANQPQANTFEISPYKLADSALHTMRNDGKLEDIVHFLDIGNDAQAQRNALNELDSFELKFGSKLTIRTYDASGTLVHSFNAQMGALDKDSYVATLPFKVEGSGASKYGIAILEVGP